MLSPPALRLGTASNRAGTSPVLSPSAMSGYAESGTALERYSSRQQQPRVPRVPAGGGVCTCRALAWLLARRCAAWTLRVHPSESLNSVKATAQQPLQPGLSGRTSGRFRSEAEMARVNRTQNADAEDMGHLHTSGSDESSRGQAPIGSRRARCRLPATIFPSVCTSRGAPFGQAANFAPDCT